MSTKSTQLPTIEEIPLAGIILDYALSGRSEKEIKANAKDFLPRMKEHGWDAKEPGQVYKGEDGKYHLLAGFSRVTAALLADQKKGPFIVVDQPKQNAALAAILTNQGHPISQSNQGVIYNDCCNGKAFILVDAENGNDDKGKRGDFGAPFKTPGAADGAKCEGDVIIHSTDERPESAWIQSPMSTEEIATATGYTRAHVGNCICIATSPEDIGAGVADGRWSDGAVLEASRNVKSDALWLKILVAAHKAAKDEGKETATKKHVQAVKPGLMPVKKQKAVAPDASPASTPVPENKGDTAPEEEKPDSEAPKASQMASVGPSQPENEGVLDLPEDEEKRSDYAEELFSTPAPGEHGEEQVKKLTKWIDAIWEELGIVPNEDDAIKFARALIHKFGPALPF